MYIFIKTQSFGSRNIYFTLTTEVPLFRAWNGKWLFQNIPYKLNVLQPFFSKKNYQHFIKALNLFGGMKLTYEKNETK